MIFFYIFIFYIYNKQKVQPAKRVYFLLPQRFLVFTFGNKLSWYPFLSNPVEPGLLLQKPPLLIPQVTQSVILCETIFNKPSFPSRKSYGADILRESSPPSHLSHVRFTCQVSHVPCHKSHVKCNCMTGYIYLTGYMESWWIFLSGGVASGMMCCQLTD